MNNPPRQNGPSMRPLRILIYHLSNLFILKYEPRPEDIIQFHSVNLGDESIRFDRISDRYQDVGSEDREIKEVFRWRSIVG